MDSLPRFAGLVDCELLVCGSELGLELGLGLGLEAVAGWRGGRKKPRWKAGVEWRAPVVQTSWGGGAGRLYGGDR